MDGGFRRLLSRGVVVCVRGTTQPKPRCVRSVMRDELGHRKQTPSPFLTRHRAIPYLSRLGCKPGNSSLRSAMENDVSMESHLDDKPAQEDRSVLSAHIKTLVATRATLTITPQFAKRRVLPQRRNSIGKETHHAPQTFGSQDRRVQTGTRPRHESSAGSTAGSTGNDQSDDCDPCDTNTEVTTLSDDLSQLEAGVVSEPTRQTRENTHQQLRAGMEAVLTDMESPGSLGGDLISGWTYEHATVVHTVRFRCRISTLKHPRWSARSPGWSSSRGGEHDSIPSHIRQRKSLCCHCQCLYILAKATQASVGSNNWRWRLQRSR